MDGLLASVAGDFDGDGIGDVLAVKDDRLYVWNGEGDNSYTAAKPLGPGWTPYAATLRSLGDVNRDGHDDLGAVADGTLRLWFGKGGNGFTSQK